MKRDCLTNFSWLKKIAVLSVLLLAFGLQSFSQNKIVTGIVTSADDGLGIPGVSVVVKGTTAGTSTDINGKYQLSIPAEGKVLVFSFVGMTTQEIAINSDVIDVVMATDAKQMDEVVVTALGIKREKKALGYAVSEVKGEELASVKENNVINSLAGKVAGVQVSKPTGGPGASSRVIIRGVTSLNGNNQPLYVVDGIPLTNDIESDGSDKDHGGVDMGDGISSLNPDDIASMNVLKGPAATALYGSRAQNGVIVITTKKGNAGRKGLGVTFSSSTTFEKPLILPEFQEVYGHGNQGETADNLEDAKSWHSSWGPKIEGQDALYYDGVTRPVKVYDNYKNFYNTGKTYNNSVAMVGGTDRTTFRFSYANLKSEGVVPNTDFNRNNFTLRGTHKLDEAGRISMDAKVSYIKEKAGNRPLIGGGILNPARLLYGIPNTYDIRWLRNYKDENGKPIGITKENSGNPYWNLNMIKNADERDRVLAMSTLNIEFTDYLKLMLRAGTDFYTRQSVSHTAKYTPIYEGGRIEEGTRFSREDNYDLLLSFNKDLSEDINLGANIGANKMYRNYEHKRLYAEDFEVTELQNVNSGKVKTHSKWLSEKETHSVFGSVQFSYKNFFYLEGTARNDWSSTLPSDNWSYFYPSVSSSLLINELVELPNAISFAKLRGSWAEVGGDTDPYQLALLYSLDNDLHDGVSSGSIDGGTKPLGTLKPSKTRSIEFGADLKFLNNRLGLDFTWYKGNTFNQILDIAVSNTSGYDKAWINAGELENKGIEMVLYASPFQNKDGFSWDIDINYANNNNKVVELYEGLENYPILSGGGTNGSVAVEARVGEAYGTIVGYKYKRNEDGQMVLDQNGKPKRSDRVEVIGNATPDWIGGVRNTFSYKNLSLSALIDVRVGGQLHSTTEASAYSSGRHKNTLPGREEYYTNDEWIPQGVVNKGTEEEPVWEANTTSIDPQEYYGHIAGNIDEEFIYDADFVKLREVSLKYTLPNSLIKGTPFQGASLSLVGRNLFYLYKATDNIDPESSYTVGNGQGFENASVASTRSVGFSLNLKF